MLRNGLAYLQGLWARALPTLLAWQLLRPTLLLVLTRMTPRSWTTTREHTQALSSLVNPGGRISSALSPS